MKIMPFRRSHKILTTLLLVLELGSMTGRVWAAIGAVTYTDLNGNGIAGEQSQAWLSYEATGTVLGYRYAGETICVVIQDGQTGYVYKSANNKFWVKFGTPNIKKCYTVGATEPILAPGGYALRIAMLPEGPFSSVEQAIASQRLMMWFLPANITTATPVNQHYADTDGQAGVEFVIVFKTGAVAVADFNDHDPRSYTVPAGWTNYFIGNVDGLAGSEIVFQYSNGQQYWVMDKVGTVYTPVYNIGFEGGLGGYTKQAICPATTGWGVFQYNTSAYNPAPGGGSYCLRLISPSFANNCSTPASAGVFAFSPAIPVTAGATYRLTGMTRNGPNLGRITLIFFNSSNVAIGSAAADMQSDSGRFKYHPAVVGKAPTGTSSMKIRYWLKSPNGYADVDVVRILKAYP